MRYFGTFIAVASIVEIEAQSYIDRDCKNCLTEASGQFCLE